MTEEQAVEFLEFYKDTIPKEPPIEAIIDKDKHWHHDNEELLEVIEYAIKAIEENKRLKVTDKRNKELFVQIKHQLDELSKYTNNWKDKLIIQSYIKPLTYLINRYVNDNDKTLFFNGLEKDCQQLQDRLFEYNQKNNSLITENKRLQEENEQLKVANTELKKTIERWNEVSYEQHEAIKKTRDEMQSLDEELCSRFLIEDCDKEAHEAYRECLDILDKYIHNMYVED